MDQIAISKREIEKCESGAYGEAPLWKYMLGWLDWSRELELLEAERKDFTTASGEGRIPPICSPD